VRIGEESIRLGDRCISIGEESIRLGERCMSIGEESMVVKTRGVDKRQMYKSYNEAMRTGSVGITRVPGCAALPDLSAYVCQSAVVQVCQVYR